MSWSSAFDYAVNGLVVGNIYALLAVGLALIYGVSHLINFSHGSIYMVGAYIGWLCITHLGTPLPVTLLAVVIGCALLGMAIERIGLRPLQGSPRIAPLLSRSEEHTSELQSRQYLVCRLLLEKKNLQLETYHQKSTLLLSTASDSL